MSVGRSVGQSVRRKKMAGAYSTFALVFITNSIYLLRHVIYHILIIKIVNIVHVHVFVKIIVNMYMCVFCVCISPCFARVCVPQS